MQGSAENIKNYFSSLKNRKTSDVIFLSYDEKLDGCEFLPNSTWAEGRNYLLELSKKKGDYLYNIFCDDDIEFIKGSWDVFEQELIKYNPKVATPIVPKTRKQTLSFLPYQNISVNDEQMIAFHRDVLKKEKIFPLIKEFDNIHWWVSCEIQENLIQYYYPYDFIQFNTINIDNTETRRYDDKMNDKEGFHKYVRQYLASQNIPYSIKYMNNRNAIFMFARILFKTFKFSRKVGK